MTLLLFTMFSQLLCLAAALLRVHDGSDVLRGPAGVPDAPGAVRDRLRGVRIALPPPQAGPPMAPAYGPRIWPPPPLALHANQPAAPPLCVRRRDRAPSPPRPRAPRQVRRGRRHLPRLPRRGLRRKVAQDQPGHRRLHQVRRQERPPTAYSCIPMESPCCSCRLTLRHGSRRRVLQPGHHAGEGRRLRQQDNGGAAPSRPSAARAPPLQTQKLCLPRLVSVCFARAPVLTA